MRLYFIPPLQALTAAAVIWFIANMLPHVGIPLPGRMTIGTLFIVAGLTLDVSSALLFFRQKTTVSPVDPQRTETLVTGGLYRFTRNPMYLGLFLILTGYAIRQDHLLGLVVPVIFALILTELQIKPEETALRAKFGQAYEDYCQRVRRWL